MIDVIEPPTEDLPDVDVIEGVEDLPTLFARPDEAHLAQPAQLM
jgi:hypothetical protein